MEFRRIFILVAIFFWGGISDCRAQEFFMDDFTRNLLDSLEKRIKILEAEIPQLSKSRSLNYYFKKNELDQTIFLQQYHRFVFDEDLDQAKVLIDGRVSACRKINDTRALDFYSAYQKKLTHKIQDQQRRYQKLFSKEKIFRKELYRFLDSGDEYSLKRARRMTDLAIKYAREKGLKDVAVYLTNYSKFVDASIFNFHSEFELAKLTHSEAQFKKVFDPMVQSDSLEQIKAAGLLVEQCINYSLQTLSVLDTSFFALQRNVVATSISDYYSRQGNNASLESIGEQAIIARMDTLNREGIYKWKDKILVVGHFSPGAKFETVQNGEAIIDADRKLIEYIRINRLAKIGKEVKIGPTYVIPYVQNTETNSFKFNPRVNKYQYMICYTRIESPYFTREISKFLPPLQFQDEIQVN